MGVELASMGITEPARTDDEVVQFTEPKRGTYKKLIIRDGRLVGGILLGDISKAAYLMQAFDREHARCPKSGCRCCSTSARRRKKVTLDEMPADAQICNCNGVSKGAIVRLRRRRASAAPRR